MPLAGFLQSQVQSVTCAPSVQVTSPQWDVSSAAAGPSPDPEPLLLPSRRSLYLLFLAISLLFLIVNLVCALLVKMAAADVKTVVLVRVAINDSLFVLCAVSLSICLYKVTKMSLANVYLESKVLWAGHRSGRPEQTRLRTPVCACVGDLGVPGDSNWRYRGDAVRIASQLQPDSADPL